MCVMSAVYDHYRPRFDRFIQPFTDERVDPQKLVEDVLRTMEVVKQPESLTEQVAALRKEIAEFREALTHAKKLDELLRQPDCEDPEKEKLKMRVAELEKRVNELEARVG